MQFDLSRPVATVYSLWRHLERDWQSVAIGVAIVALIVLLEVPVPW